MGSILEREYEHLLGACGELCGSKFLWGGLELVFIYVFCDIIGLSPSSSVAASFYSLDRHLSIYRLLCL